jgi:hypothetical protein
VLRGWSQSTNERVIGGASTAAEHVDIIIFDSTAESRELFCELLDTERDTLYESTVDEIYLYPE